MSTHPEKPRIRPRSKTKTDDGQLSHGAESEPVSRTNRLFYGDNLTIMRGMASNSVDLIYLDPPFNSQRTYNLIYTKLTGLPLPEQEEAFCDAWQMDAEKEEMARQLPVDSGYTLVDAARDAFVQGLQVSAAISALVLLSACVLALVTLRQARLGGA